MINNTDNKGIYLGMDIPISSANINGTGLMLYERLKYTVQDSMTLISTANSNLDGTGTLGTLVTGASNGTMIKRVTIKARGTTTQGMIRLFTQTAGGGQLYKEIEVPPVVQSSRDETLIAVIDEYFFLASGNSLKASTEKGESFVIFTESVDVTFF